MIGIITHPIPTNSQCNVQAYEQTEGCFKSFYPQWIESGGGRVVPIGYTLSEEKIDDLLSGLNGVLITGGDVIDKK